MIKNKYSTTENFLWIIQGYKTGEKVSRVSGAGKNFDSPLKSKAKTSQDFWDKKNCKTNKMISWF